MKKNYYNILEISISATQKEIKTAYRKLAKKYHPDKNPNDPKQERIFKRVNTAYQILSDLNKKLKYDNYIKYGGATYSSGSSETFYTNYEKEKPKIWKFNMGTLMYGKIFVICLIAVVLLTPVSLFYFSSKHYYNQGLTALREQDYFSALYYFDRAIVSFGAKGTEAAIESAKLELYIRHNFKDVIEYCNAGFKHAEKKVNISKLYFLRARAFLELKDFGKAKEDLEKSIQFNSNFE